MSKLLSEPTSQETRKVKHHMKYPQPTESNQPFRAHTNGYKRLCIRNARAKGTVIASHPSQPGHIIISAVFRTLLAAAAWAEETAALNPNLNLVVLDATGIAVSTYGPARQPQTTAARLAEITWRGSKPIPRGKSKPPRPRQPTFWEDDPGIPF
jgi:hypothetical protein